MFCLGFVFALGLSRLRINSSMTLIFWFGEREQERERERGEGRGIHKRRVTRRSDVSSTDRSDELRQLVRIQDVCTGQSNTQAQERVSLPVLPEPWKREAASVHLRVSAALVL